MYTLRKCATYKRTNQSPVVAPVDACVSCSNVASVSSWLTLSAFVLTHSLNVSSSAIRSSPVATIIKAEWIIRHSHFVRYLLRWIKNKTNGKLVNSRWRPDRNRKSRGSEERFFSAAKFPSRTMFTVRSVTAWPNSPIRSVRRVSSSLSKPLAGSLPSAF